MRLYKRNNIYWIDYYEHGRRIRKSTGLSDRDDAMRIFNRLKFKIAGKRIGVEMFDKKEVSPILISDYQVKYLESNPQYTGGSASLIEYAFKWLIKSIGDKPIHKVSTEDARQFKVTALKSLSPATYNMHCRSLATAWKRAIKWTEDYGFAETNPFLNIEPVRVNKKIRRVLTNKEITALYKAILNSNLEYKERYADFITVLLVLSLRRGEALNINTDHIKRRELYISNRKDKEDIKIPLSPLMVKLFKKYNGRVFDWSPSWAFRLYKRFARKAKIEKTTLHSLRHTSATIALYELDTNVKIVQELLGHSDADTTEIYLHSDTKVKKEPIRKISDHIEKLKEKAG